MAETVLPEGHIAAAPRLRCGVAVVGSGPGGAITAALLAEAGRDVLLVEEGAALGHDVAPPFSPAEMAAKYRNGGLTVTLGSPRLAYAEGRVVGGGSEINAGLYHRTPPQVLESWRREYRVAALGEEELEPHFAACERALSVSLPPGPAPLPALKLREGARRLGWQSLEAPRWFRHGEPGSGSGQGVRQSMSVTFIPRALRAGARLLSGARVDRLRRESGGWTLLARQGEGEVRIRAETVFLACGAVQTPALLRRSGIKRQVGNTLSLHPTVKVVAVFPEPVNFAGMGVPGEQVKEFAPRLSFGCSLSTRPTLALAMADHPGEAREVNAAWQHAAIFYAMTPGHTGGRVRPLPGFRDPLVRYRMSAEELRDLADGLRKLAQLLFAAGAERLYPSVTRLAGLRAEDDAGRLPAELPRAHSHLMSIHLFSSCPMGEDEARCPADSFGRLRGADGLYLSDASLLCTAPGVNPQGSLMALAHRNAKRFLGEI